MAKEIRGSDVTANGSDVQARVMLVFLCLIWGFTWPIMKIALEQIPPLSMRASSAGIGALTLFLICRAQGRSFYIPSARAWGHVVVASILNVACFSVFSAFAQNAAATSRVAILTYTMPIWAVLFGWLVLGERPMRVQGFAIALCVAGLAILIRPLATAGIPLGVVLAVATGLTWAAGTVYLKWARIAADPMGVASWQLTVAFVIIALALLMVEGHPHLGGAHTNAILAVLFTGVAGNAIAYGLWFAIVRRLSAVAASLGILGIPVIGVLASVLILGERPTASDIVGFALIFAATVCVLLFPQAPMRDAGHAAS